MTWKSVAARLFEDSLLVNVSFKGGRWKRKSSAGKGGEVVVGGKDW